MYYYVLFMYLCIIYYMWRSICIMHNLCIYILFITCGGLYVLCIIYVLFITYNGLYVLCIIYVLFITCGGL